MKVDIHLDVTPEELRRFFGLPDVAPLNTEAVELMREQLRTGAGGLDAADFLKPYLAGNMGAAEQMQKAFWDVVAAGTKAAGSRGEER